MSALPAFARGNPCPPDDDDYRDRQEVWLSNLTDAEFASLAQGFFELNANRAHYDAFLKYAEWRFERDSRLEAEL